MAGFEWITFLSDYGLDDNFVGVCHGVIARTAPAVRVIDITHTIEPQGVRQGAHVLLQSLPFMPRAVHLAVVDPGVGTRRRPVAIEAGDSALVGPDNGLLVWAADTLGGIRRAHEITNRAYQLERISSTFHGRDVFAPVAAHLALGLDLAEVGPALDPAGLERLASSESRVDGGRILGEVVLVDHFDNLQLNIDRGQLGKLGIRIGDRVDVRIAGRRHRMPFAETFGAVPTGRTVLCEDSFRLLCVAVNQGRAAELLQANAGDPVVLGRAAG
ncbi:MAG TPA: SAM-dependent chlorinase/fluorinase [Actinomycetes bacterium]|nr:SAM-dependent chlorinase/fluorinase [Actinomycetes bacterium]